MSDASEKCSMYAFTLGGRVRPLTIVTERSRAKRSMSSYDTPPSLHAWAEWIRGSSSLSAASAIGTSSAVLPIAFAYSAFRNSWVYLVSSFHSFLSKPTIWWFVMKVSRALSRQNSGISPPCTYRGRCSSRNVSACFFCHALMSARSTSGEPLRSEGPIPASSSIRFTMSIDSPMTSLRNSICRIGAIFLPTRAVGVSLSSFIMKRTSCLMFFIPKIMRARTQKGQWSYT
mmetsp:Transcript_34761/g.82396  ORF Transcript_34761/g.82396 Transcript_34761/m.82396 type:complete len:230 (-) Transcript_34761:170-859(-)